MGDGLKEIVLALTQLFCVKQGKLTARGMPNFEGSLIEVSRPGPKPISTRSVTGAVYTVTPYTFGEIHPFPSFYHFSGGWWR
jgi:hypothetical protein